MQLDALTVGLGKLFAQLGLTRDSAIWFWSRAVSGATIVIGIIAAGGQHTVLNDYLSAGQIKAMTVLAVIVLWLAGKFDSSPLQSAREVAAEKKPPPSAPVSKSAAGILLLVVGLSAMQCASLPAKQRATTTLQTVETILGAAQDYERANYEALGLTHRSTPAQRALCPASSGVVLTAAATEHQAVSCLFAVAFQSEADAATALLAFKAGDPLPTALTALQSEVDVLFHLVEALPVTASQRQLLDQMRQITANVLSVIRTVKG